LCTRLIAKVIRVIRISLVKFHCNRFTAVQDIQDYASLIFVTHCRSISSLVGAAASISQFLLDTSHTAIVDPFFPTPPLKTTGR